MKKKKMGRQIKDNNIYSMSTSVTFNSAYKTYKSMHRVQSHKEPVIYLRSIHQIWVILEVVGIDKSKQEVFYRFGTPLTMGCPSTVIIPIVFGWWRMYIFSGELPSSACTSVSSWLYWGDKKESRVWSDKQVLRWI